MVHCKLEFPEVLKDEANAISQAFYELDPDGDWDEAEWQAFFDEHASEELKALMRAHDEARRYYEELEKKTGSKIMYG